MSNIRELVADVGIRVDISRIPTKLEKAAIDASTQTVQM